MKKKQVREFRNDELSDKLIELEKQLFNMRSQAVTENISNTSAMRNLRKDIARVKTVIRERQLQDQKS